MNSSFNLNFVYRGGWVKRFHTMFTLRQQNVAEHSFGVAWICEFLTDGKASKNLIMAALAHDLAEQIVGDIPAPAKRALGIREVVGEREDTILRNNNVRYVAFLKAEELKILKLADALDGMAFCVSEIINGNGALLEVFDRFGAYVSEIDTDEATNLRTIEIVVNLRELIRRSR